VSRNLSEAAIGRMSQHLAVARDPEIPVSSWISDIHSRHDVLGKAEFCSISARPESEHLFLVGDIVDGGACAKSGYWRRATTTSSRTVLRKAEQGHARSLM